MMIGLVAPSLSRAVARMMYSPGSLKMCESWSVPVRPVLMLERFQLGVAELVRVPN